MNKIATLFLSGLIAICFSLSTTAQSPQQDLDQVELLKQFIGTWTEETDRDTTILWEVSPFGKGYDDICYWQAKGETFAISTKGFIGFTKQDGVMKIYLYRVR